MIVLALLSIHLYEDMRDKYKDVNERLNDEVAYLRTEICKLEVKLNEIQEETSRG